MPQVEYNVEKRVVEIDDSALSRVGTYLCPSLLHQNPHYLTSKVPYSVNNSRVRSSRFFLKNIITPSPSSSSPAAALTSASRMVIRVGPSFCQV